jgi:hypothetical protein
MGAIRTEFERTNRSKHALPELIFQGSASNGVTVFICEFWYSLLTNPFGGRRGIPWSLLSALASAYLSARSKIQTCSYNVRQPTWVFVCLFLRARHWRRPARWQSPPRGAKKRTGLLLGLPVKSMIPSSFKVDAKKVSRPAPRRGTAAGRAGLPMRSITNDGVRFSVAKDRHRELRTPVCIYGAAQKASVRSTI